MDDPSHSEMQMSEMQKVFLVISYNLFLSLADCVP